MSYIIEQEWGQDGLILATLFLYKNKNKQTNKQIKIASPAS